MARPAHILDANITEDDFLASPPHSFFPSSGRASEISRGTTAQRTFPTDTKVTATTCIVECPSCSTSYSIDPSLMAGPVAGVTHSPRFQCTRCNSVFLALPKSQWPLRGAQTNDCPIATNDVAGEPYATLDERKHEKPDDSMPHAAVVPSDVPPPGIWPSEASQARPAASTSLSGTKEGTPTATLLSTPTSSNSAAVVNSIVAEQDQSSVISSRYSWKNKDRYFLEPSTVTTPHAPHENVLGFKSGTAANSTGGADSPKRSGGRASKSHLFFSSMRFFSSLRPSIFLGSPFRNLKQERLMQASYCESKDSPDLVGITSGRNIRGTLITGAEQLRAKLMRGSRRIKKDTLRVSYYSSEQTELTNERLAKEILDSEICHNWREDRVAISARALLEAGERPSRLTASPVKPPMTSSLLPSLSLAYSQNSGETSSASCEQLDSELTNKMAYQNNTKNAKLVRVEANSGVLSEAKSVANGETIAPMISTNETPRTSPILRTVWDSTRLENRGVGREIQQETPLSAKSDTRFEKPEWKNGGGEIKDETTEIRSWRNDPRAPVRGRLPAEEFSKVSPSNISTANISTANISTAEIVASNIAASEPRQAFRNRPQYYNSTRRVDRDSSMAPTTGTGDGLPPSGQLTRIFSFSLAPAAVVLLLVLTITLGSFYSRPFAKSIDEIIFSNAVHIPPAGVFVEDASLKEVTLDSGEKLFVISGSVRNESTKTLREIAVEGILFARDGTPLSRQIGYAGTPLADSIITSLSMEMIDSLQGADQGAITILEPNVKIPFVIAIKPPASGTTGKDQDIPERIKEDGSQPGPSHDQSTSSITNLKPTNLQPSLAYYSVRTYSVRPSNNSK